MLYKVGVRAEEGLHFVSLFFQCSADIVCQPLLTCKDNINFSICKVKFAKYVFFFYFCKKIGQEMAFGSFRAFFNEQTT